MFGRKTFSLCNTMSLDSLELDAWPHLMLKTSWGVERTLEWRETAPPCEKICPQTSGSQRFRFSSLFSVMSVHVSILQFQTVGCPHDFANVVLIAFSVLVWFL